MMIPRSNYSLMISIDSPMDDQGVTPWDDTPNMAIIESTMY